MRTVTNERGSVIVFITLMVVILMVMVGIGLDTGQITYSRNLGQSAVDAAALSAVSGLPSRNATEIANRAIGYNGKNDYMGGNNIQAANVTYVKYDYTTNSITIITNRSQRPTASGSPLKAPMPLPRGPF